jgi:small subunit ribosomal protein S17e
MGIKPSYIKTLGQEILMKAGDKFTRSFDENKQTLMKETTVESKRVRNRIAGYVTRKINTGRHP